MTKEDLKELSYNVLGAAIEVHKSLGPGLLESIYHECLKYELGLRGLDFVSELIVPVQYKEFMINTDLRCDLFVEGNLVVELKSVKEFVPVFDAQILSYMKLLKAPRGILLNFNSFNLMNEGQKTFVNEYYAKLE